ncbi:fibronectin type III domain-containing protein [Flagellimonas pelagia]|uniref:Fibronectin type-III domain-containing protein n=1 Tax=Flagellimonas pelagia TaxID=2306998 RepID=A0A3A1NL17_9FLAO|nr:fibronectin type III domain-containing protein [Allomuricauda maritima]RIV46059.1 hypothetical protein D2V05_05700 [Allomuricauda maritima]TXJ98829.1 hypothetical protein FQ017_05655 [Allomuricauda maritima]
MKLKLLFSTFVVLLSYGLNAQNLHTQANAASIENEANATTGWTGTANITSSTDNPFQGTYAISSVATQGNSSTGRDMSYTFNAVVGEVYNISIWARQGNNANSPAFANWSGFAGFATTTINSANWTEYTWTLTATNPNPVIVVYTSPRSGSQAGNQVFIDNVSITPPNSDTEAPSAITDLSSSNITMSGASLSWSASTDNVGVTNYEVFRDGVSVGNSGTTTSFNATGLSPNTSYNFTVFAEDAAGNVSAASNVATVNTLADTQAPTSVTSLTSSNITSTGTTLTWASSTDNVGVTNYEVFQDGVSIGSTGTTTNINVSGLTPSTSYDFTVFAQDAAGNVSIGGNTETVVTLAPPDTEAPSAVNDLASSNITDTSVDLSWSASLDNIGVTGYLVFQDGIEIGSTGSTSFNVTGLSPSTSYDFTVFAEDAAGNTSVSGNTESVTTTGTVDTEAPSAVIDLTSSNTTSTSSNLSWSVSSDNVGVTNYQVVRNGIFLANTGTSTNFNVTGLTPDTTYDFTVLAQDAAGNTSTAGNTESVTTLAGSGVVDYTSENANLDTVDWTVRDLFANQNVGIGTTNTQGYRLAVAGNMIAEGVKVELQGNWPDFVFEEKFQLMDLEKVREYIKENGHLPNIPSAEKIKENGIDLGDMDAKLLQKIEELTLYILRQQNQIELLQNDIKQLKGSNQY